MIMDDISDKKRKSRAGSKDPVDASGKRWTKAKNEIRRNYKSAYSIPAGYRIEVSSNQNAKNPPGAWEDYAQLVIKVFYTSGPSMNTVMDTFQRGRYKTVALWFAAVAEAIKADGDAPDIWKMFGATAEDAMPSLLRHDEQWVGFSEAYAIYCAALFQSGKSPDADASFKRMLNRAIANGNLRGRNPGTNPEAFIDDLEKLLVAKKKGEVIFRRPAPPAHIDVKLDLNNRQFRELSTRDVIRCGRAAGVPISTRKAAEECGLTQGQSRSILRTLKRVKIFSETGHGTKMYKYIAQEDQERRIKRALSLPLSG